MKNYIFGPVISRRLGYSLGIDFTQSKFCNMDCLYCECGVSTKVVNKKTMTVEPKIIIKEFKKTLSTLHHLDFITFTGTGEPALYEGLNEVYKGIKKILKTSNFNPKFAIITNSTMFCDKDFFNFALKMDVVLPSVDGISVEVVEKINRPAWDINWEEVLECLINFQKEFKGEMWVETFVLDKINTEQLELNKFIEYFKRLKPHKIQINTIDRPPAYQVRKPSDEAMKHLYKFFKEELVSKGIGVEVLLRSFKPTRDTAIKYSEELLISLISRRPVPMYELLSIFGVEEQILQKVLQKLIDKLVITKKTLMDTEFFVINGKI